MQVQRTFKKREGVWGIVMGDMGGASQVAPLSPLTKLTTFEIQKRCFASLNMTRFQLSLRGDSRSNQPYTRLES